MPLKGILSRPSTSAGGSKRFSTFEPSSQASRGSSRSPERGHRKIGSLQRLSLSFAPSQNGTFHQFLSEEPDQMSRQNSLATASGRSASRTRTDTTASTGLENPHSNSVPILRATKEDQGLVQEDITPKPQRFSLRKFRYASEPQLSTKYKDSASVASEPPPPPTIITTAPTQHHTETEPRKSKDRFLPRTFSTFRKSMVIKEEGPVSSKRLAPSRQVEPNTSSAPNLIRAMSENSPWKHSAESQRLQSPPPYGDESTSALALPLARLSESGGSEGSSASHKLYARTTTTHFIETTTTIFKLKRNKKKKTKDKGSLFPLPEKFAPPSTRTSISANNEAESSRKSMSPSRRSTQNVRWRTEPAQRGTPADSPNVSVTALTNAPLGSPGPVMVRNQSTLSVRSGNSTPTGSLIPPRLGARGRSSTLGSLGRSTDRLPESNLPTPSGRNSMSTTGRRSFGDLLTHKLRKDSAPTQNRSNSGSTPASKSNSFQMVREPEPELVYPPREAEDTPATYLEKLEAAVPRGAMATVLCKGPDDFSRTCLRKYMRGFSYFGESIDVSIRKMLMEVILPKETQQIDRLLQGFADRYHECNPGIFVNEEEANFVSFSILLLQSDNHNKNNKRKMTKQDYVKNTQQGRISVAEDVLDCLYDNICYTPFIHFDDEIAVNNHRLGGPKRKPGLIRAKSSELLRGPVDPYSLILDNKLEVLRPSLKDVIETEDSYGIAPFNTADNHRAFVNAAVLQIVSARSRPDAFTTQATITNPAEAQVGIVSIKVAKVGLLWRKSTKKKKAKSPWQEWGVVLTDSKLYFFKDIGWIKKLIGQYEGHTKITAKKTPLVFKPPMTSFDPDAWMALDDAVALTDGTYRRHKNAFTFIKHGGFEEVFLANSDNDVLDWISKLNYAATFRTAGVRMRGLLGTNYEGRNIYRKDSEVSVRTNASQINEQPIPTGGTTNPQLAWEISFYRRQLVSEKISTFDDHVAVAQKELDYLVRNARHLLLLSPIQQKTREALVLAAGRMNAKLKWTRKEIWRARTHRDILVKDLEAEATSAFPAPAAGLSRGPTTMTTPLKTTPTKASLNGLTRSETDQTLRSNMIKSPTVITPGTTVGERRPSQTILEHIITDHSEPPELASLRRRSAGSQMSPSPRLSPRLGDDQASQIRGRTPSVHTQTSQHFSVVGDTQAQTDVENEENVLRDAGLLAPNSAHREDDRRGSDSGKDQKHNIPYPHDISGSMKDRAGSVRRSLHRTLRDPTSHVHMPHHTRSKKGRESGSSLAMTEDGRSVMSGESEELKRDPTGRFVLHGKKASVITMGPEWLLSSEDRIRLREQMLRDGAVREDSEHELPRGGLHINTDMIDAERKSVEQSVHSDDLSPGADIPPEKAKDVDRRDSMTSNGFSVYSAVTVPETQGDIFHSAESSPRASSQREQKEEEDESTIVKDDEDYILDKDGLIVGLKHHGN